MLSLSRLKEALHYDPISGQFTWLISRGPVRAGEPADHVNARGYVKIRLDGKVHSAHRLAFFYMTGTWPPNQVDHIDRVQTNNRWCNLRLATGSQNQANCGTQRNNVLGIKGVSKDKKPLKKPYIARIRVGGRLRYIGRFASAEEASSAYRAAAKQHYGEFAA